MNPLLKSRALGTVTFRRFADNKLWYVCEDGFEFPVPVIDTTGAIFGPTAKAVGFMRWIRKRMEEAEWERDAETVRDLMRDAPTVDAMQAQARIDEWWGNPHEAPPDMPWPNCFVGVDPSLPGEDCVVDRVLTMGDVQRTLTSGDSPEGLSAALDYGHSAMNAAIASFIDLHIPSPQGLPDTPYDRGFADGKKQGTVHVVSGITSPPVRAKVEAAEALAKAVERHLEVEFCVPSTSGEDLDNVPPLDDALAAYRNIP